MITRMLFLAITFSSLSLSVGIAFAQSQSESLSIYPGQIEEHLPPSKRKAGTPPHWSYLGRCSYKSLTKTYDITPRISASEKNLRIFRFEALEPGVYKILTCDSSDILWGEILDCNNYRSYYLGYDRRYRGGNTFDIRPMENQGMVHCRNLKRDWRNLLTYKLVPQEAKVYPFEPTPEGFIQYLNNSVKWDDTSLKYFYNPRLCYTNYLGWKNTYKCDVDYDVTTSLGKRTCINGVYYYSDGRGHSSEVGECSKWEKVQSGRDGEKEPLTPESQDKEIAQAAGNAKIPLDAGGLLIFVGVVIGIAFSKLLGRKTD